MADLGALLCVLHNMSSALDSLAQKEIFTSSDATTRMSQLQGLMSQILTSRSMVQYVLASASISTEQKKPIQELRDAVYELDDLVDELVATIAECTKQTHPVQGRRGAEAWRSFCTLISRSLEQSVSKKLYDLVDCSNKLNRIHQHRTWGYMSVLARREETCSFVNVENIVGRQGDLDAVVDALLIYDDDGSCVSIVGFGGIGKTTLAQLVVNDERVRNNFRFRSWVCVNDVGERRFDVNAILAGFLASLTNQGPLPGDLHSLEELQRKLQEELRGKRYLLILDGVWLLFQKMAFRTVNEVRPPKLVELGYKILQKCCHLPLFVKAVGRSLYGQNTTKWPREVERMTLLQDLIIESLKLSYDVLEFPLKSCFSYCALFPENSVIDKRVLIALWISQGYILPFQRADQRIEDAGEECFSILLEKGFLEVVQRDEDGDVVSLRVHNLMHYVARYVAKDEICVAEYSETCYHVYLTGEQPLDSECSLSLRRATIIRSYLHNGFAFGCDGLTHMPSGMDKITGLRHLSQFVVAEGILSKKQLNAELRELKKLVNLTGQICISIPTSYTHIKGIDWRGGCLEDLEHLREVWVRFMESHSVDNYDQRVANYHQVVLEKLQPHRNITRLKLWGYQGVTILKWGVAEQNWADTLPGLISIELRSCENLQQLPLLSKLPHLKSLKLYGLRNLECLENNTSPRTIFFPFLEELIIADAPNLRGFWDGVTISDSATFPTKLVSIELRSCDKLQYLPSVSKLDILRSLKLYGLSNLEFLGKITSSTVSSSFLPALEELDIVNAPKLTKLWTLMSLNDDKHCAPVTFCFISLKSLMLANLPELKGFACLEEYFHLALQFDQLQEVRVSHCPKLWSMADVPTLRSLEAINIHVELLEHLLGAQASSSSGSPKLQKVDIASVLELQSLPTRLSNVQSLTIRQCQDLLCTPALGSPTQIKRLIIQECCRLKCVLGGLNHLSCLEELEIEDCQELDLSREEEGVSSSINNLRSLRLTNISDWESLIGGLGHLTAKLEKLSLSWLYNLRALPDQILLLGRLSHLSILSCPNLTALPESLGTMSTLKHLEIENCPRLKVETISRLRLQWPRLRITHS